MNQTFANYSASTAFFVQLTKVQCNALLRLSADGFREGIVPFHTVGTLKSLDARGLVYWGPDEEGKHGFMGLTKAGELMVQLLQEAGLTIENTTTVSVHKRAANE